jgi:lipoprotein-releasing system permease protein
MRFSLVPFIAMRYLRAKRKARGLAPSLLSVLGVAVGVMTLTVVLGVMNGFQLGFIESIVEISSYHVQIHGQGAAEGALAERILTVVSSLPSVTAVIPFSERQVLVEGMFFRPRPCTVRAVPPDLLARDPVQRRLLALRSGSFSLSTDDSIVIGSELAAFTGTRVGDSITLVSVDASGGLPAPRRVVFTVTGIFSCGYYDFDVGLAFISLSAARRLAPGGASLTYGIKLTDRVLDAAAVKRISAALEGSGFRAESWREYNRSFFDALFMEKLMMMLLVGLIFVVVGFNIYTSLRRTVFEKKEEIAVLKAVGVPPRSIQYAFIFEGLVIGMAGALAGMLIGLALAANINAVFSAVEVLVNAVMWAAHALSAPFRPAGGSEGFAIFSPLYFYLTEVPSRVLLPEAFLVAFFATLASVAAAYGASRTVAAFRPAEILRYE